MKTKYNKQYFSLFQWRIFLKKFLIGRADLCSNSFWSLVSVRFHMFVTSFWLKSSVHFFVKDRYAYKVIFYSFFKGDHHKNCSFNKNNLFTLIISLKTILSQMWCSGLPGCKLIVSLFFHRRGLSKINCLKDVFVLSSYRCNFWSINAAHFRWILSSSAILTDFRLYNLLLRFRTSENLLLFKEILSTKLRSSFVISSTMHGYKIFLCDIKTYNINLHILR